MIFQPSVTREHEELGQAVLFHKVEACHGLANPCVPTDPIGEMELSPGKFDVSVTAEYLWSPSPINNILNTRVIAFLWRCISIELSIWNIYSILMRGLIGRAWNDLISYLLGHK